MRRMLLTVLTVLAVAVLPVQAQHMDHKITAPDDLKWVDAAPLPGAKIVVLHGDPSKEGLFVYRFKFPANFKVPAHYHKASESVTVVSGEFFLGTGEKFELGAGKPMAPGAFAFIPPTHRHWAYTKDKETVVQVHGVGPTDLTFVNPAEDPRKK